MTAEEHAAVWRKIQEEYRMYQEDEEHAIEVGAPDASDLAAAIARDLRDFAEIVAHTYEQATKEGRG